MKNISLQNDPVELKAGQHYIMIDALYVNDIKEMTHQLNTNNIWQEIKEKVFPFTHFPFIEYTPQSSTFSINQILKQDYTSSKAIDAHFLSVDSGVILIVNKDIFFVWIELFNYDEFVDSILYILNVDYYKSITKEYELTDLAVIVASSIDTKIDFNGSGLYRIITM